MAATQTQTAPHDAFVTPAEDMSETSTQNYAGEVDMRCPDPSAHKAKDTSLQDHASAAALHSTGPAARHVAEVHHAQINPLGPDGKLSSASAATSLKYARASDLPGYPIAGLDNRTGAGTAANIANAHRPYHGASLETWKPAPSAAAGKAALLANDYKMAPAWEAGASSAGSRAALLAHHGQTHVKTWAPEASADGHSAATLAMARHKPPPAVDYGHTADGGRRALIAATGAVSASAGRRQRALSMPVAPPQYPDSQNSARNALSAATLAHRPSMAANKTPVPSDRWGSGAMEAARIQHSKSISRDMYTSTPPVALEVEEKRHNDALRASAISMAKKMYDVQERQSANAASHASRAQAQSGANHAQGQAGQHGEMDIKAEAIKYIGIQEAAQKLANERLAKLDKGNENAAYRSYYGYEKQPPRNRLSLRLGRNRAASNPETADSDDDDDALQSRRIRSQMNQFNRSVADVDAKKQDQDRKHLLAAAQRKVDAQMQGLDKKIFDETGQMSQAMISEWDAKARAKASAASEERMENHGKVHIGGGKYMDQEEIDAVALARIQPTLDEIAEKTEKRRAAEEERRLDLELKKREARTEKERAAELKAEEKLFQDEEKKTARQRSAEEKIAARQEKEAEKSRKAEEKRLSKQEKRKSKTGEPVQAEAAPEAAVMTTAIPSTAAATEHAHADEPNDSLYQDASPTQEPEAARPATPTSPTTPTSPKSPKGFRGFLSKIKRHTIFADSESDKKSAFIGGAALGAPSAHSTRNSVPSSPRLTQTTETATHEDTPQSSVLQEAEVTSLPKDERRYSDVSSISAGPALADQRGRSPQRNASVSTGGEEYEEARDAFDEKPLPAEVAARKFSPTRDSRFREVGI